MDDGYMDHVQVPFRLSHNISLAEDGGGALDRQRKFYSDEPPPCLVLVVCGLPVDWKSLSRKGASWDRLSTFLLSQGPVLPSAEASGILWVGLYLDLAETDSESNLKVLSPYRVPITMFDMCV